MNQLKTLKHIISFMLLIVFIFQSCYREEIIFETYNGETLNFTMSIEDEERVYKSRSRQILIDSPAPMLYIGDQELLVDRFKTRGQNTLNFTKKSFSVNLDKTVEWNYDNKVFHGEKFKLISMVYDYTYIENRIAFKLFEHVGLWNFPTFYTEVKINDNHNGLYLFIPDPESYAIDAFGAEFALRRDYWDGIRRFEISESATQTEDYYTNKYLSVYDIIQNYNGTELYNKLNQVIDLKNYFRMIAVNYLIKNGDYTDEVFFYTKTINNNLVFSPIPWDCDDIFEPTPHEIGRKWGFGPIFNERNYNSIDDKIADVGNILMFSVEEDLDYKIAKDEVLYNAYLEQAKWITNKLSSSVICNIFNEVYNELLKYYSALNLEELSKYDERPTSTEKWELNIDEKRELVLEQLSKMNAKLESYE